YEDVAPGVNGRLQSAELGLEFGIEAGFLRAYTLEGGRLRSHREAEWDREAAEVRAAEEAERRTTAERERAAAERERASAEERLAAEAARRTAAERERAAAEERAAEERARREELERQLAALQAEIDRRGADADTPKEPG